MSPSVLLGSDIGGHDHDLGTRWSGAEHVKLGEEGFNLACAEFDSPHSACTNSVIYRKDRKVDLNYGKIVALGDFYKNPESAYMEQRIIKGLEKAFKCIDDQGKVHAQQETHPDVDYPDCTWVNIFSGTKYLKVLSTNINHFGWYNIIEYITIHEKALDLALVAHDLAKDNRTEQAEYVLNKALFYNAFGDHYLTDAFSAGHVRVPRKQLKSWARKNIRGMLRSYVGDSLGNILHDSDGRDRAGNHIGLHVKNSMGQEWLTHCDNHLHSGVNDQDPVIKIPVQAVSASVQEVFSAYKYGTKPEGVFQALNLVPFVNDRELHKKFKLTGNRTIDNRILQKLRNGLDWPLRMITSTKSIEKMIHALSGIMTTMGEDIQKEIAKKEPWEKRMPEEYKKNYSNIK